MTCFHASAGEFICPSPDAPAWLTGPLPYTGLDFAVIVAVALLCFTIGLAVVAWSRRG